MRNITLSADEQDIEAARARARLDRTTLNEQFRLWLASYARANHPITQYENVMSDLRGNLVVGGRVSREARNAR